MTYEKFKEIINGSLKADWLFNDEKGIYTFKDDLNISIERVGTQIPIPLKDWAPNHLESCPTPAYREDYEIYYGASFIECKTMVEVSSPRAVLPLTIEGTDTVSAEDYHFAEILDQWGTLKDTMQRAQLQIERKEE